MAAKVILIIDDEEYFCKSVQRNLEAKGNFRVIAARNGKQGIEQAKRAKPDLILLDVMMPGMDGLEVLKTLKENPDTMDIPVVMFTVEDDEAIKVKATQLYDEQYITKPIEAADLTKEIEKVLRRKGIL